MNSESNNISDKKITKSDKDNAFRVIDLFTQNIFEKYISLLEKKFHEILDERISQSVSEDYLQFQHHR